ncbi:MAG: AbrB/MazE/SpoVT family DNA-binding domain-containing protein [Dehalococcoidia bacterium]|jgi:bifunctional DNA-binding transcriptional regulator/antitoxin component of YhaV-PrlF toxin-antitoxin module
MEDSKDLVAIKRYKVASHGLRGRAVALPRIWLDNLGLKLGDTLVIYQRPGSDDLIVRPERKQ